MPDGLSVDSPSDSDPADDPLHQWRLGQLLQAHGQHEAARAVFEGTAPALHDSLARHPDEPERLAVLIDWERGKGRLARALELAQRQARNHPDQAPVWWQLAWIAVEHGDHASALQATRHLLRHWPEDPATLAQAAFIFAAAGDLLAAAPHAEAAVFAAPGLPLAWRALAQVRHQQERRDEALAALETALQLQPGELHALRQMGWVLLAENRFAAARLACMQAHEAAPDYPVARRELIEACLRGGEFAQGFEALQALPADEPATRLLQARLLTEGGAHVPEALARAVALCRALIVDHQRVGEAAAVLARLLGLGASEAPEALSQLPHAEHRAALREALKLGMGSHGHDCLLHLAEAGARAFPDDGWLATAALYLRALNEQLFLRTSCQACNHKKAEN